MSFPEPPQSKKAVNRAGVKIANGCETDRDIYVVDQWRGAHGYVLNTFQLSLKRQILKSSSQIIFAQRLKRRKTVIDKLKRQKPDGSRLISDVTSMQDYAGCRLIFDTIDELKTFRKEFHASLNNRGIQHRLKHEVDKYNYIENPKSTGYRGIHDIIVHNPRPHRAPSTNNKPWHGLLVEIQYRTKIQNSWATAVEMVDLIDNTRTKFALKNDERVLFFAYISELIARHHEDIKRKFLDLDDAALRTKIQYLEEKLKILSRLSLISLAENFQPKHKHVVLALSVQNIGTRKFQLQWKSFSQGRSALNYANKCETDNTVINAVYVRSENQNQLKSAFKNYFNDSKDFLELVRKALGGNI